MKGGTQEPEGRERRPLLCVGLRWQLQGEATSCEAAWALAAWTGPWDRLEEKVEAPGLGKPGECPGKAALGVLSQDLRGLEC